MQGSNETPAPNGHERALTPKQTRFVAAYLATDGNATEAAKIAGYSGDSDTLKVTGSRLKHHPEVAKTIREQLDAAGATVEVIVAELLAIATAEWRDFLEIRTNPRTGEVISVKMDLTTKERALEFLGKCHGLGTEQVAVNVGFVPKRIVLSQEEYDAL
jgi:hypothetical protein